MPRPATPRMSDGILAELQARVARLKADPGLGEALVTEARSGFRWHTGPEVTEAYLRACTLPGRWAFAGGGAASEALLARLTETDSPLRLEALVSLPGGLRPGTSGLPQLGPEELRRDQGLQVLLCPSQAGRPAALALAGELPGNRLLDPSRDPRFREVHDALVAGPLHEGLLARIRAACPRVKNVVLLPHLDFWAVVEEETLAEALPPETTVRLYYGPPGKMPESVLYPTFDLGQCLPLAEGLLHALAPHSLYVRTSAQFRNGAFPAALRAAFPGPFLALEVYDYATMLEDVFLNAWGYSPGQADAIRNAELLLALEADLVLDKTPGAEWEQAASALLPGPRCAYAPTLGTRLPAPRSRAPRRPGPLRILCAGSMPYFHNYRPGEGFPGWAYPDIIEPILELTAEPGFQVDIFNASHDPALDHWPAFGGYATLFDPRRVHYHPRIPLAEVQARLPEYDYGMFLFAPSTVVVDYPLQQSLPNRCMSYLAGDLPLIVNTEMRHLAGLVDHFSAGLTISCQDLPSLATRLRLADHSALRSGAAALHRHLVAANRATLDALSRGLAQKVDRIGQT